MDAPRDTSEPSYIGLIAPPKETAKVKDLLL